MSASLKGKQIVLGVCGGIAAYKSAELLRLLTGAGAGVRVILTAAAEKFVGAVTFEALSGRPVCTGLFERGTDAAIRHISWAEEADGVVVAPATANFVGKLAGGIADDALTTFMLAVTRPVLVCPSMNTHMYEHAAVQRNLDRLRADGHAVLAPDSGELACGTTGAGRLPDPDVIRDRLAALLTPDDLDGRRILVTAGPTREALDPVRFLSNPSSGKMGYWIARAAEHRGARVTLVSGPSGLPAPAGVETVRVESAAEMAREVLDRLDAVEIVIKAAAVSDYRPAETADHKLKKTPGDLTVSLKRTTDILREIGRRKNDVFLVGFAAETRDLEENARKKMAAKNLDLIVANLVNAPDAGFGSDTNRATLFHRDGRRELLKMMSKEAMAHRILDHVAAGLPSAPGRG